MKMLVRGRTTSGWQGKQYCALHDLLASAVGRPAHPDKLQVSQTLTTAMDAYGLVVPHHPRCHLPTLPFLILLLLLHPPCHW